MSMNISSNYGSYPPIINSSQLSDMKTALQVQEKIAENQRNIDNEPNYDNQKKLINPVATPASEESAPP